LSDRPNSLRRSAHIRGSVTATVEAATPIWVAGTGETVFSESWKNLSGDVRPSNIVQTVNARDVHRVLKVGRYFADWIKGRINQRQFREGIDLVTQIGLPNPASQIGRGGNKLPVTEYHVSINMAQHLCAMENNPEGHQYRQYLFEVEKIPTAADNWLRCTGPRST
jgi:phage anti-repressor protein